MGARRSDDSRGQVLEDLRARAARSKHLLFNELPRPLRLAIHRHWGTMAAARKAARLPALRPGRPVRWTRDGVLQEIRKLHRAGVHLSYNAVMKAGRNDLVVAACKAFGGWSRARDLAGVAITKRKSRPVKSWDAELVVAEIRRRRSDGEPLAVSKVPAALANAANRIFGSWKAAVEAAGIDYDTVLLRRVPTDEEILEWLRALARKRPRMRLTDFDRVGQYTVSCRRRWGSIEAAAAAAGLEDWPVRTHHEMATREEVVQSLKGLARARQPLNFAAVRKARGKLVSAALKHFPSWDQALVAAGLEPQRLHRAPS